MNKLEDVICLKNFTFILKYGIFFGMINIMFKKHKIRKKKLNDFEKPSQKNFTRWILPLVMSLLGLGTSRRDFRLTNHLNGEQTLDIKFASVTCKKLGLD